MNPISITVASGSRGNRPLGIDPSPGRGSTRAPAVPHGELFAQLEPRHLLAAIAWDGGGDGSSWNDALNWSNNALPTSANDVTINIAGDPLINFNSGVSSIRSLDVRNRFSLSGGSLSVAQPSRIRGQFALAGGSLGGGGQVTVEGTMFWSGGSMEGTGKTVIAPAAVVNAAGSTLNLWRSLDNGGQFNWGSGRFDLINATWTNLVTGTINASASAQVQNLAGGSSIVNLGTFNKIADGSITVMSPVSFVNNGAVNVLGGQLNLTGGGVTSGTFQVASLLSFEGSQVFFASSAINGPGSVNFANSGGGSVVVNGSVSVASVSLNNVTAAFNGPLAISGSLSVTGSSTVDLNTAFNPSQPLSLSDSTLNVNADQNWPALNLVGGTIGGSGRLTIANDLTWSSGNMIGTGTTAVGLNGILRVNSSSVTLARRLEIAGATNWTSGNIQMQGGTLANLASGTFLTGAATQMLSLGGTNAFTNAGTLRTAFSSTTTISSGINFSNSGTLDVSGGSFNINAAVEQLDAAGTLTAGTWIVDAWGLSMPGFSTNATSITVRRSNSFSPLGGLTRNTGTLTLDQVSQVFSGGGFQNQGELVLRSTFVSSPISNTGTVRLSSSNMQVSGSGVQSGNFELRNSSTLTFSGSVTVSGILDIESGTLAFNGGGTLTPSAVVVGGGVFIANSAITHQGSTNIRNLRSSASGVRFDGPVTANNIEILAATEFNGAVNTTSGFLQSSTTLSGSGTFTVTGDFRVNFGTLAGTGRFIVAPSGSLTTTTGHQMTLERRLENFGRMTFNNISASSSGQLINQAGGILNVAIYTGTMPLVNFGEIQAASVFAVPTFIGVPLENNGRITGNTTMTLQRGGVNRGSILSPLTISQGDTFFVFETGSIVLSTVNATLGVQIVINTPLSGGSYSLSGATLTANASFSPNSLSGSSSRLQGSGVVSVMSSLTWNSGELAGTGRLSITPSASAVFTGATISKPIDNFGNLTASGTVTLREADINNAAGAILRLESAQLMAGLPGTSRSINNSGLLQVSGTVTFATGVELNNYGELLMQSSALTLSEVGVNAGTWTINNTILTLDAPQIFTPESSLNIAGGNPPGVLRLNVDQRLVGIATIAANIDGPGTLTFGSNATWSGGSMVGSGRVVIEPGVTLSLPSLQGDPRLLNRSIDINGTLAQTGGSTTINAGNVLITIAPGGTLSLTSGSLSLGNSTLINNGTLSQSGGTLSGSSARITNNAAWTVASSSVSFTNNTTITNSLGATLTFTAAQISNDSQIINNGSVTFAAGSTTAGTIRNNATLNVNLGSARFGLSGTGTTTIGPLATWDVASIAETTSAAIINAAGTMTFNSSANSFAGTLNLSGTLTGAGPLGIDGELRWTAGSMTGLGRLAINPQARLTMTGTASKTLSRIIDNFGTANWSGGQIQGTGGTVNNFAGATFTLSSGVTFNRVVGTNTFQNAGTLIVAGSTPTAFAAQVALHNSGVIQVNTGGLTLSGPGLHSGQFIVANGLTLTLAGGTHTLTTSGRISGAGTASIAGATLLSEGQLDSLGRFMVTAGTATLNSPHTIAALTVTGGTLNGSGEVTATSQFLWQGGTLGGTGRFVLPTAATATLDGLAKTLSKPLNIAGSATLSIGALSVNGGSVEVSAGGSLALVGAAAIQRAGAGGTLNNAGAITRSGAGTSTIATGFTNNGVVTVAAGTLALSPPTVATNNGEIILPVTSRLAVTGDFTQSITGRLRIELDELGSGRLTVSGQASLRGAVRLDYDPSRIPTGRQYTLVTAGRLMPTSLTVETPATNDQRQAAIMENSSQFAFTLLDGLRPIRGRAGG